MKVLLALVLLALPATVPAAAVDEFVEIRSSDRVTIRPDRAYFLFRTSRPDGVMTTEPVFMRIPSAAETARYHAAKRDAFAKAEQKLVRERAELLRKNAAAERAGKPFHRDIPPLPDIDGFNFIYDEILNVRNIDAGRALVKAKPESVYLVEGPPGEYVLYGVAVGPGLHTCMCLGTVGFPAKAGVVTDLGHFLGDRADLPSIIPELRPESGYGPSVNGGILLMVASVRPAPPGIAIPDALRGATVLPADYRAIGKFTNPGALLINRLVPVPGVLAYDNGRVIDVKSGSEARGSR